MLPLPVCGMHQGTAPCESRVAAAVGGPIELLRQPRRIPVERVPFLRPSNRDGEATSMQHHE
ncbi:hypothetical protein WJ30_14205 [Burkholderia diffusa]|nr:hypothetical protein WJ30_14205 [Burkholderia diffusa]